MMPRNDKYITLISKLLFYHCIKDEMSRMLQHPILIRIQVPQTQRAQMATRSFKKMNPEAAKPKAQNKRSKPNTRSKESTSNRKSTMNKKQVAPKNTLQKLNVSLYSHLIAGKGVTLLKKILHPKNVKFLHQFKARERQTMSKQQI